MKRFVVTILALLTFTLCFGQNSLHDPAVSPTRLGVAINVCDFALYDFNAQVVYRPTTKFGIMAYFAHGNARTSQEVSPSMEELRYEIGPRWYVTNDNLIFLQASFSYVDANFWTNRDTWTLVSRGGSSYYSLESTSYREDIFQAGLNLSIGASFELYRFVYLELVATYGYRWASVSEDWRDENDSFSSMSFAGYAGPMLRFQGLIGFNLF